MSAYARSLRYGSAAIAGTGLLGYMTSQQTAAPARADWFGKDKKQWREVVLLFGPPGAGKGTHAPKLTDEYRLTHLSTGDMLRAAVANKTEVGLKAKKIMTEGGLVGDDIVRGGDAGAAAAAPRASAAAASTTSPLLPLLPPLQLPTNSPRLPQVLGIIKDRVEEIDCGWGFILDGFPRTVAQAEGLDEILAKRGEKVTKLIELNVPDEVLDARITGRWIHKKSGRSYHVSTKGLVPKSYDGKTPPSPKNMLDDVTGEPLMQRPDDTSDALKKRLNGYHTETAPIINRYKDQHAKIAADKKTGEVWDQIEKAMQ